MPTWPHLVDTSDDGSCGAPASRSGISPHRADPPPDLATAAARRRSRPPEWRPQRSTLSFLATATPGLHLSVDRGYGAGGLGIDARRRVRRAAVCRASCSGLADRRRTDPHGGAATALVIGSKPFRASSTGATAPPASCSATAPARWCWKRRAAGRGPTAVSRRSCAPTAGTRKLYVNGGPSATRTVGHLRMEGRGVDAPVARTAT